MGATNDNWTNLHSFRSTNVVICARAKCKRDEREFETENDWDGLIMFELWPNCTTPKTIDVFMVQSCALVFILCAAVNGSPILWRIDMRHRQRNGFSGWCRLRPGQNSQRNAFTIRRMTPRSVCCEFINIFVLSWNDRAHMCRRRAAWLPVNDIVRRTDNL